MDAKRNVKRNGRGQIISYELEQSNGYGDVLLSDTNRQEFVKLSKQGVKDTFDSNIVEFDLISMLANTNFPVKITKLGFKPYIEVPTNIDLGIIANVGATLDASSIISLFNQISIIDTGSLANSATESNGGGNGGS